MSRKYYEVLIFFEIGHAPRAHFPDPDAAIAQSADLGIAGGGSPSIVKLLIGCNWRMLKFNPLRLSVVHCWFLRAHYESNPMPILSIVRRNSERFPLFRSARTISVRMSCTPVHAAGSGGNGMGFLRTSSRRVSSVSSPESRSSMTLAPKRVAPTPKPV